MQTSPKLFRDVESISPESVVSVRGVLQQREEAAVNVKMHTGGGRDVVDVVVMHH